MKRFRLLFSLMTLTGLLASGPALADHHFGHGGFHDHDDDFHGHFGIYLGAPYPFFPGPFYPYDQPLFVTPPPPVVYIERPAPLQAKPNYYWYHCNQPKGYYPYVKACPGGWQKVIPTPPPK